MQQDLQELLKQNLRDIHLPAEVGLWPPAPGWWLIASSLLVAIAVTTIKFRRHRTENGYRRVALKELHHAFAQWQEDNNSSQYLQSANSLLRRCILHVQGNKSLVGASGESWANVLNHFAIQELSGTTQHALTRQCYQHCTSIDVDVVHIELVDWIKSHQPAETTREKNTVTSEGADV